MKNILSGKRLTVDFDLNELTKFEENLMALDTTISFYY